MPIVGRSKSFVADSCPSFPNSLPKWRIRRHVPFPSGIETTIKQKSELVLEPEQELVQKQQQVMTLVLEWVMASPQELALELEMSRRASLLSNTYLPISILMLCK